MIANWIDQIKPSDVTPDGRMLPALITNLSKLLRQLKPMLNGNLTVADNMLAAYVTVPAMVSGKQYLLANPLRAPNVPVGVYVASATGVTVTGLAWKMSGAQIAVTATLGATATVVLKVEGG